MSLLWSVHGRNVNSWLRFSEYVGYSLVNLNETLCVSRDVAVTCQGIFTQAATLLHLVRITSLSLQGKTQTHLLINNLEKDHETLTFSMQDRN